MRVYVLSRERFNKEIRDNNITNDNVESKDVAIVSINNNNDNYVPYLQNKNNVKVMYFDDVEHDMKNIVLGTKEFAMSKAFTEEQGRELIDFIDKNRDKSQWLVHCTLGISRSGAVGLFINDYLGGDYQTFKRDNPGIVPNVQVTSILKSLTR